MTLDAACFDVLLELGAVARELDLLEDQYCPCAALAAARVRPAQARRRALALLGDDGLMQYGATVPLRH